LGCSGTFQSAKVLEPKEVMIGISNSWISNLGIQGRVGISKDVDVGIRVWGLAQEFKESFWGVLWEGEKKAIMADVKKQMLSEKKSFLDGAVSLGVGMKEEPWNPMGEEFKDPLASPVIFIQGNLISSKTIFSLFSLYAGIKAGIGIYKVWKLKWEEMPGGVKRTTGFSKPARLDPIFIPGYGGAIFFPKSKLSFLVEWELLSNIGIGVNLKL
jgi:hypothetical protein